MPSDEKIRQVSVALRLRGDSRGEVFSAEATMPRLNDLRAGDAWYFDHVYQPCSTNSEIFETSVQPSVASVCRGAGGIILAGGVAETGRMLTSQGDDDSLLGRAVQQIFAEICTQRSRRYWLHVSYVEVTATRMWDLLASGREVKLDERHRAKEISRRAVRHGPEDIGECLNEGNQCRSRSNLQRELKAGSHSVFMLDMDMEFRSAGETKMQKSTLTLVDLHGLDSASMSEAIGREASRKDIDLLGRALRRLSGPLWALLRRPLESTTELAVICSISTNRKSYAQSRRVVDAAALLATQEEEEMSAEQLTIRELQGRIEALQGKLQASASREEVTSLKAEVRRLEKQHEELRSAYAEAMQRAEDAERRLEDATRKLEEFRRVESEKVPAAPAPAVTPVKEPRPRRSRVAAKSQPAWQHLIGLNQPAKRRRREEEAKPDRLACNGTGGAPPAAGSCEGPGPDAVRQPARGWKGAADPVEAPAFSRPSAEERMEALLAERARGVATATAAPQPTTLKQEEQPRSLPLLALPPPPGLPSGVSPTPPDPSPPRRRRRRASADLSEEATKAALAEAEAHQVKIQKLKQDLEKKRQGLQTKRTTLASSQEGLIKESPTPAPAKRPYQAPMPKVLPKPVAKQAAKGPATSVDAPSESEVALSELRERLLKQRGEAAAASKKQSQAAAVGEAPAAAPAEGEEAPTPPRVARRDGRESREPWKGQEEAAPVTPPPKRAALKAQYWSPRDGTPAASADREGDSSQSPLASLRPSEEAVERPSSDLQAEEADRSEGRRESDDEAEFEEEDLPRKPEPGHPEVGQEGRSWHRQRWEEQPAAKAPALDGRLRGRTEAPELDGSRCRSPSRRTEASHIDGPHGRSASRRTEASDLDGHRSASRRTKDDGRAVHAPQPPPRREAPPPRAAPPPHSWTRRSPRAVPAAAVPAAAPRVGYRPSALGVASRFRPGAGRLSSRANNDNCAQM